MSMIMQPVIRYPRSLAFAAAMIVALGAAAPLARAADAAVPGHQPACIQAYNIENTTIPDDSTILFHMRDGSVWKNSLPQRCVGLRVSERGFTYEAMRGSDELCSNFESIRVNDTGSTCMLGAFTEVTPHHQ